MKKKRKLSHIGNHAITLMMMITAKGNLPGNRTEDDSRCPIEGVIVIWNRTLDIDIVCTHLIELDFVNV